MHESAENRPEAAFVESLAAFLKASFVYPENNIRVQDSADACWTNLRELARPGQPLTVRLTGDGVRCGGVTIEAPLLPLVAWFKATFEATAVARIELQHEVPRSSLLALARRLRENFVASRRNPVFEELWPDAFDGLILHEPRVGGQFRARAPKRGGPDDGPEVDTGQAGASLHRHPGIAKRVQDLQEVLTRDTDPSELREADIVSHIVQMLPHDIRSNPVALIKTVESILLLTTDQMRRFGEISPEEFDFRQLLLRICKKFFVREDEEGTTDPTDDGRPKGHAGDELVTDDLPALLREFEQLPRGENVSLDVSSAERFGVCVHQLLTTGDLKHIDSLKPRLVQQLAEAGPNELKIIRQSIGTMADDPGEDGTTPAYSIERLLALLRDPSFAHLLRSTLVLPNQVVVRSFPANFCLFLDSLDPAKEESMQQLDHVARQIGPERLLQKTGTLLAEGVLEPERVGKLMARPWRSLLPFATLILRHGDRTQRGQVVQFLRKLDLDAPAAAALCVDEFELTGPFLLSLCEVESATDARTTRTAAHLLQQFISSPSADPEVVQRQVYAIHGLRRLWSPEVAAFVKKLARRGFRIKSDVPKALREAAREVLRQTTTKVVT